MQFTETSESKHQKTVDDLERTLIDAIIHHQHLFEMVAAVIGPLREEQHSRVAAMAPAIEEILQRASRDACDVLEDVSELVTLAKRQATERQQGE